MAPDQDDAVLPEGDLSSSSSQDEEEDDDVVDEDEEEDDVDDDDDVINSASPSTSSAGATDSLPIKCKLQLDFNKNQLVEKLRRLKKKYRNVVTKIESGKEVSFKSPHDQATFEISRKIWSNIGRIGAADDNALDDEDPSPNPNNPNFNSYEIKAEEAAGFAGDKKSTPRSRKRSRIQPRVDEKPPPPPPLRVGLVEPTPVIKDNNNGINSDNGGAGNNGSNRNVHGLIEETVKSCLSPLFKELLSNAMGVAGPSRGFGGLAFNPIPLSFGAPLMNLNFGGGEVADDKWRKQQILELEVYSKRLDLVQNQIKVALEELRSNGG
ncbi:hypothetical protein C1H46_020912 [Malus baccata]|uniref:Glabrous enhancer-binding protein-like DBD domain-containing protein n=1 Tax=Malus baccata TaxID=106549 RepID=A0A540M422_MALBA|nr:hypothetical protein C1H46_020912 [Malus baccata]